VTQVSTQLLKRSSLVKALLAKINSLLERIN
jgi:hypothetical protein